MRKIGTWSRGSDGSITVKVPKWSTVIKDKKHEWIAIYGGSGSSHVFKLRDVEVDLLSDFGDHVKLVEITKTHGTVMELK